MSRFADLRVAKGFATQAALGEAASVDPQTIHRIESKPGYSPRASTIGPLAAALGITTDELRTALEQAKAAEAQA